MEEYSDQVKKHCHECSVPLRGYGELAQASDEQGTEQCSITHQGVYRPKRKGRKVEVVDDLVQLGVGRINRSTSYLQNTNK